MPADEPPTTPATNTAPQPAVPGPIVLQEPERRSARWVVIRDLMVFQAKLFIDGLKDLVLGPLTLVAGIADLFAPSGQEGKRLYRVLRQGQRFERWINLFEPVEREDRAGTQLATPSEEGVDGYFQSVEKLLVDQVRKEGMTAQAKEVIDGVVDDLRRNAMLGEHQKPPEPSQLPVPAKSPSDP